MNVRRRVTRTTRKPGARFWMLIGMFALVMVAVLSACSTEGSSNQNSQEATKVNDQQAVYAKNQPVPFLNYSYERDLAEQLYIARAHAVDTYTVVYSFGKPVWACPSKGYPIPYTTQLTNPEAVDKDHNFTNWGAILPQAEPNGLYTGTTAATFFVCVRKLPGGGTENVPVYAESDVQAFPFPVKIVDGQVIDAGDPSGIQVIIDTNKTKNSVVPTPVPSK